MNVTFAPALPHKKVHLFIEKHIEKKVLKKLSKRFARDKKESIFAPRKRIRVLTHIED